jgi:hypothetical protein
MEDMSAAGEATDRGGNDLLLLKKVIVLFIVLAAAYLGLLQQSVKTPAGFFDGSRQTVDEDQIARAFRQRAKDIKVSG